MDKKIIKGLIDEKLEVIQEQFSIIREYQGKIPIIELDLIMNSIRDLYELVLSLQLENVGSAMPKTVPISTSVKIEMNTEEIPASLTKSANVSSEREAPSQEVVSPVRLAPSIISMEPATEEEPVKESSSARQTQQSAPEPKVTPVETPAPEPEGPTQKAGHAPDQLHEKFKRITPDLFSEGAGSTLADRLRTGDERRIVDKLQENKVADLRTTIGINDKFLFINELFEGNMRVYDEVVQKLNACTTAAQADLLLLDLKIVYNWDSESPTVKKFVEIARRKF